MVDNRKLRGNVLLLWATSGDILYRKARKMINPHAAPLLCGATDQKK